MIMDIYLVLGALNTERKNYRKIEKLEQKYLIEKEKTNTSKIPFYVCYLFGQKTA